jgi:threonine aldolase
MLGGGMRQAGIFAAAGLVALDTMVDRLAEDHANARRLAELVRDCGLPLTHEEVATNMVFIEVSKAGIDPEVLVAAMRDVGVIVNPAKAGRLRFVTHADISAEDIEEAGRRLSRAVRSILPAAQARA